jgi:Leucine-rich repeat (LRR) protein
MPSLRTLYLSKYTEITDKNRIENISAFERAEFPSLNTLSLGRNLIQSIKPLTRLRAPFLSTLVLCNLILLIRR